MTLDSILILQINGLVDRIKEMRDEKKHVYYICRQMRKDIGYLKRVCQYEEYDIRPYKLHYMRSLVRKE